MELQLTHPYFESPQCKLCGSSNMVKDNICSICSEAIHSLPVHLHQLPLPLYYVRPVN